MKIITIGYYQNIYTIKENLYNTMPTKIYSVGNKPPENSHGSKRNWIIEATLNSSKFEGITIPDFKTNCNIVIVNLVPAWKHTYINGTELTCTSIGN